MVLPTISGEFRVAKDPELRYAPSGTAVATVVAVASRRKQNDAGEWEDVANCWVRIKAFKSTAENVAESLAKGDVITVTGRVETEDWEDKDGNKRTSVNVVADSIGPALIWNPAVPKRAERRTEKKAEPKWETPGPEADSSEPPF